MTTAAVTRVAYGATLAVALGWAGLILAAAAGSGTLGFDYKAYDLAVDNLLAGRTMYDPDAQATGAFGLFFYPPPFALLVLPVALLPADLGVWVWTALLVAASVAAIWLMPVPATARWITLLLAALSWPLVFAIKLGQAGPIVLLLFSIGWRWMDRPRVLGVASGLGTIIKIQPALLVGWAVVTGRRRAALVAVVVVAVLGGIGTVIAGPGAWLDEASLLARVSQPVLTPHGVGVGRLAYEAGAPELLATALHWLNLVAVAAVVAWVTWRGSHVASYLAVVVASHFVSPVLWDHYALVLLLPVAWLVARRRWLAVLIPLVTATPFIGLAPSAAYPLAYWVTLAWVAWLGLRDREADRPAALAPT